MASNQQQIQLSRKLDRLEEEISRLSDLNKEILKRINELELESNYPPENKIRKSYIKHIKKIDRQLEAGNYKVYKTFEEFERAVKRAR